MFDPLKDSFRLPEAEQHLLDHWKKVQVFERLTEATKDRKPFVFYEGPPTANGKPGIHHVLARTLKDTICRFRTMSGYFVDRRAGWDTHGLPVEIEVEKKLGLEGRDQVEEYGIAKYNAACRESVLEYKDLWDRLTTRMGYWVDLDKPYITFRNEYIETVWWLLKQLWDKDLLYQGYKIQWYSPGSHTVLSSHEVSLGYKEVQDPSVYVRFKVNGQENTSFLAWTTTPWTLISNAALAVGPEIDYVKVRYTEEDNEELLILARARLEVLKGEYEEVESFTGKDLVGLTYTPLFDYFKDDFPPEQLWRVVPADYVSIEDGTGIVHQAPAFGAEDFEVSKKEGIALLNPVERDGTFSAKAPLVEGMWFKDADKKINRDLRERGLLFRQETVVHNYPMDWRKGTPLMSYPVEGWFIRTTKLKERLIELNKTINWLPEAIGTGRFGEWLENNVDWALSRRRYWGTPLPIWKSDKEDSEHFECIGSIEELRAKCADQLPSDDTELDLHRPMVDELTWAAPDGGTMRRVPDLIDVWFDSGAMPFAQWHYPFENKKEFEANFPADFIAEGLDQTRGWFYTLHAIGTLVMDSVAYKNCLVNGLLLDETGEKMSKSKGNIVNPFDTINQYGADPVRWYLVTTSQPWLPTRFDFEGLKEVIRKYFETLRNTYSFFAIYANIDRVSERADEANQTVEQFLESKAGEEETFDRWIVSRFNTLAAEVSEALEAYDITKPSRAIQHFVIEELSNWYVRNNRRRFWAEDDDPSKMRAYLTLYRMLIGVCKLSAPVAPFFAEVIWMQLTGEKREERGLGISVHMTEFPKSDPDVIDRELETTMDLAEKIVRLGRAARARRNLKVRQPLGKLMLGLPRELKFERLTPYLSIIREELNVKEIETSEDLDTYVSYGAKLNFKAAGPRLGKLVKRVGPLVQKLEADRVKLLERGVSVTVEVDGESIELSSDEVLVERTEREGFAVESEAGVTVALETELTEELVNEGFARELVSKIQTMRKKSGLEVTDKIKVQMATGELLQGAVDKHRKFISHETLAEEIGFVGESDLPSAETWDINGESATIAVVKI